jgi:hypothetical protein
VYSATVHSRPVPVKDSARTANIHKVCLVPWLVLQNGLPYALAVRFVDGFTARRPEPELAPGEERQLSGVAAQALVQFKLAGSEAWSEPVSVYREMVKLQLGRRSVATASLSARVPYRHEPIAFGARLGLVVLSRRADPGAQARATCGWSWSGATTPRGACA